MRLRRNGSTDDRVLPDKIIHSAGYVLVVPNGHPLAVGMPTGSRLYEHRRNYYDAHGYDGHSCNWCGVDVSFDAMHVDHVNAVRDDNRISNLVASCPPCNKARGVSKMRDTMRANSTARLIHNGIDMCMSEWATVVGISPAALNWRINNGWDVARALTTKRGKTGPKPK